MGDAKPIKLRLAAQVNVVLLLLLLGTWMVVHLRPAQDALMHTHL